MIAREQVGIKAHIGRSPRVGVVSQAKELGARDAGAELHQGGEIASTNFRSKDDDQILLAPKLLAKSSQCGLLIMCGRGRLARAAAS